MPATDRSAEVLDALGRAVVGGALAEGAAITLESIQTEHGVSRSVARDCVKTLESLGLVVSRRRVGVVVRPRSEWQTLAPQVIRWQLEVDPRGPKLGALTELRAAVEPVAAASAARRATEEQCSRLLALAAAIHEQGSHGGVSTYLEADIEFHRLILSASQNDAFAALTGVMTEVLRGRARLDGDIDIPKAEALELHERVARAIAEGDAEEAEEAMRALVAEVRRLLLDRGLRGYARA